MDIIVGRTVELSCLRQLEGLFAPPKAFNLTINHTFAKSMTASRSALAICSKSEFPFDIES